MIPNISYPPVRALDYGSVRKICGGSEQAMIYGFGHCGYGALCQKLAEPGSPLKKVLDCTVGNNAEVAKTLEGRIIQQIDSDINLFDDSPESNVKICSRMCKAGITNIVLENYKRANEGLPLIPVIFCVDSANLPLNPSRIASKEEPINHFLTHQELRRAFKLCCEFDDPAFKKIALATFKFTELVEIAPQTYQLKEIPPFWARNPEQWNSDWSKRRSASVTKKNNPKWQLELHKAINQYNRQHLLKME